VEYPPVRPNSNKAVWFGEVNKVLQILRNSLRPHLALLAVLAIYLAVTLAYGLLNPLGEAPDEVGHITLIQFIGRQGRLPANQAERQDAGYKSDAPMLYHALIGLATRWIDYDVLPALKINDESSRYVLIEDGHLPYRLIHTDDEAFPYRGVVLLYHLARLASTLLGAGTLVVIYAAALTIRPGHYAEAIGTSAVVAALPRFHFMASAVNDDNLLGLLAALFTLALLRAWREPVRRSTYLWLGLWFGLAMTTKYSVVLLSLLVAVVLVRAVRRGELGWQAAAGRLLLYVASAACAGAWWLIYLEWNFNQVRQAGWLAGLIKPLAFDTGTQQVVSLVTGKTSGLAGLVALPNGATAWEWATLLFQSFWFAPGQADVAAVAVLSLAFLALSCLALAGLVRAWRRHDDLPRSILALLVLQLGLVALFPVLRFYMTHAPSETGQGRHILFPAVVAIGLLLTAGVAAWLPAPRRRLAGLALAGGLLTASLVTFFGLTLPAFPSRLPVRTSADAAREVPNPINTLFGSSTELIGYQVGEVSRAGALPVTLIWRSQAYVDQDYLVELSLLDQEDQVHSLWVGQPVDGHYPTRAWDPGDVVRDAVWLPLTGVAAGDYRLQLRLCSADGACLPLKDNRPGLYLTDVAIPLLSAHSPSRSDGFSGSQVVGFDVWQAGQPSAGMPTYRYRAVIPITLHSQTPNLKPPSSDSVSLVGPDKVRQTPQAQAGDTYIFLVGARWPSGEYRLQVDDGAEWVESEPILRVSVRPRNFDVPPMMAEVRANFGDEMLLLGYDFPEHRAQPGGTLPITLYWQALRPMVRNYTIFNRLLNSADLRQWGERNREPQDDYSTFLWAPGEVVRDEHQVPVSPDAPPGVYRLDVGVYTKRGGAVSLVKDGKALDDRSVAIAPIKVGGPPPDVVAHQPMPQVPRADRLGDAVTLLGYDLQPEAGSLDLTLYWRCDARLPADYTTFVHVRRTDAKSAAPVAQMDRPPAEGAYPTSLWDPGEIIRDVVRVPMPAQVPPGEYEIVAGLYEFASGVRLPVTDAAGERAPDDAIALTTITVGRK
jgi:hypothetical protein